jgi:anthranilate 1,2-dioxygenase small subunit
MLPNADLEARVLRLLSDYTHCIDDERYEEWPEFFCDPCIYRITTRAALKRGYLAGVIDCESKGMLIDRINSLRHANIYEPHAYRHLLGPTRITSNQGRTIKARTGFVVMRIVESQSAEVFLTGTYDDTFDDCDGEVKIAERIVVLDSSRVDTLLVIPV